MVQAEELPIDRSERLMSLLDATQGGHGLCSQMLRCANSFLHHSQDAEDVTQDVFVRLLGGGIDRYDPIMPFKNLAMAAVANRCRNELEKRKNNSNAHRTYAFARARTGSIDYLPAESPLELRETKRIIRAAIVSLPRLYRRILLLRSQNVDYREIARRENTTVGTISGWMNRGRVLLKQRLIERGYYS